MDLIALLSRAKTETRLLRLIIRKVKVHISHRDNLTRSNGDLGNLLTIDASALVD